MDVSDFFSSARGGGRGSPSRQEGGGFDFLLKIPGERGAEGPGGCLRRIGDFGGAKYFFSEPKKNQAYHWGQNYYIPLLNVLGNYFRLLLQETLQHNIPGGLKYCNVTNGAVLPWKERIFRLRLQFFSRCCVGIHYCNVTPFLQDYLSRI